MADYIYVNNPARLRSFLEKIQEVGVPDKVTIKYLEGLGFKDVNDRRFLVTLKDLGFIHSSGEPSDIWKKYRNKRNAPTVLAEAIKKHYARLYQTYTDAHLKDNEALRNFFSTHTTLGAKSITYIVRTFKAIASLAKFDAKSSTVSKETMITSFEDSIAQAQTLQTRKSGLVLNVNIQLTLPEGATSETFEDFFKAMRKHLFD